MHPEPVQVNLSADNDVLSARLAAREMAQRLGVSAVDATLIVTAVSELARNILTYAGNGRIGLRFENGSRRCLTVEASDDGPGIPDIERAMQDGFSTSGALGLGLPGVRRLMDEFEIQSAPGRGTRIRASKFIR